MKRFSAPFCLTFFGTLSLTIGGIVFGYTMGHGRLATLYVPPGLLIIFSVIVGSVVVSFGFAQPARLIVDAFRGTVGADQRFLQTNVLICECASRASLFGGTLAFLLGLLVACDALGQQRSAIGAPLVTALVAPATGLFFSSLMFRTLKARFLNLQRESVEKVQRLKPWTTLEIIRGFCYGVIVAAILSFLTASYLIQIGDYLRTIFR